MSSALAAFNRRGFLWAILLAVGGLFGAIAAGDFSRMGAIATGDFSGMSAISSRMISSGIALLTPAAALRRRNAAAFCASDPNRATLQVSENHSIIALPPTNYCTAT